MGRVERALLFLILAALVLTGGITYWGYTQFTGPGPSKVPTTVLVAPGAGFDAITESLAGAGVVSNVRLFRLTARLTGAHKRLRAGEYLLPAGIAPRDVLTMLQSGKTVVRRLTIAEGLTTAQVRILVAATDGLKGTVEEMLEEGTLLPETYHFSWGDSRQAMIVRMRGGMEKVLRQAWAGRAEGLPFKRPEEALILASIVEKETALPEERARVAAVFVNRLRRGMRLQSDPTVVYAVTRGKVELARALSRADLQTPSPYNTYVSHGLPPGPICNPGLDAIAAALHPLETKELYFVADGSGGHVFAQTLAAHNGNVAKWRKKKKTQGAK